MNKVIAPSSKFCYGQFAHPNIKATPCIVSQLIASMRENVRTWNTIGNTGDRCDAVRNAVRGRTRNDTAGDGAGAVALGASSITACMQEINGESEPTDRASPGKMEGAFGFWGSA
jgi:hypothetical protein